MNLDLERSGEIGVGSGDFSNQLKFQGPSPLQSQAKNQKSRKYLEEGDNNSLQQTNRLDMVPENKIFTSTLKNKINMRYETNDNYSNSHLNQ